MKYTFKELKDSKIDYILTDSRVIGVDDRRILYVIYEKE